ncbi:nucleotidyltransferase family protein [Microbacterium sp.]|uniref:nucleotidyltransferase family protein n=1 Tax=Microbacterium sp. TaxID=51671 RepID=UPI0039E26F3B
MAPRPAAVCGVVLAAGAGSRFGGPKILARTPDGVPWVHRVVAALADAGCELVLVTVGAGGADAAAAVPASAVAVPVADWAEGLSASLRAALRAAELTRARAVIVVPVDAPDLPASVCRRLIEEADATPDALARAVYGGRPGHPVLIGRNHWAGVCAAAVGDRGAADYLRAAGALRVELGREWHGFDVDRPD